MTTIQSFEKAGVKYFSNNFKEWFLPLKFNAKAKCATLVPQKLPRNMSGTEILVEMKPSEVSLEEIAETLKTLDRDLCAVFYCKDKDGVFRLVYAVWLDWFVAVGWYLYALPVAISSEWGAGLRVLSCDSRDTLSPGSFDPLSPGNLESRVASLEAWRDKFIEALSKPQL